jgi:tape measure domain-containing protein
MGAGADLNGELTKLKEVAKLPGLGFKEAIEGSVRLQAAGFSADNARRTLMSFGNALATVGKGKESLDLVTLALTQMQNKTSGFGQDMRQLTEQLPQLRGALDKVFGTSETDKIAEMGYTGAQVVAMLTDEFAKLPKVTGGVGNALENLQDSLFTSSARMGEAIDKAFGLENRFNQLGDKITELTGWFTSLDPETQKVSFGLAGLFAAAGPVSYILGQILQLVPKLSAGFSLLATRIVPISYAINEVWNAGKAMIQLFNIDFSRSLLGIKKQLDEIKGFDITGGLLNYGIEKLNKALTSKMENSAKRAGREFSSNLGLSSQILNFATGSKGDGTYKVPLVAPASTGADFMKTGNDLGKKLGDGIKDSLRRALVQSQIDFENFLAKIEALTLKQNKIGAVNYGKAFADARFSDVQKIQGKGFTPLEVNNLPLPKIDSGVIQGIQDKGIAQRQAEFNEQLQETIDKLSIIPPRNHEP